MKEKMKNALAKVKDINVKKIGNKVGSTAAAVCRPVLSFTDGVREGWKNGD